MVKQARSRMAALEDPIRSPRSASSSRAVPATTRIKEYRYPSFGAIHPDRLAGLRSGSLVCRAVLEFAKFFWSHHGSSAKQEIAVEARHASFARFPHGAGAGHRAGHG